MQTGSTVTLCFYKNHEYWAEAQCSYFGAFIHGAFVRGAFIRGAFVLPYSDRRVKMLLVAVARLFYPSLSEIG